MSLIHRTKKTWTPTLPISKKSTEPEEIAPTAESEASAELLSELLSQVRALPPSAKEYLFRRLMADDGLSYLREKDSIIGFEVDLDIEQTLSGFTLIAIQKHTIYAYCADFDEEAKLILFPPLDKLFDPSFELLGLIVTKRDIHDSSFTGRSLDHGQMSELVKDLTPPEKEVDIPASVLEQMAGTIDAVKTKAVTEPLPAEESDAITESSQIETAVPTEDTSPTFIEEPEFEEPMDDPDYTSFDDYEEPGYDTFDNYEEPDYEEAVPEEVPMESELPVEDARTTKLKLQSFNSLSEVSDFCSGTLGVNRALAVNVVNKALQSPVSPEYRIALAVKLFAKLFDEKKI